MPRKKIIILTLIIALILLAAAAYFLLFTTEGSLLVGRLVGLRYLGLKQINVQKAQGSLAKKLTLNEVELSGLKGLPGNSLIKIQKAQIQFSLLGIRGLNIKLDNARLRLPNQEVILFYGNYAQVNLDFNIYSSHLDIRGILGLFPKNKFLKNITGSLRDVDIYLKGTAANPQLSGELAIERLSRESLSASGCPVAFDLTVKDLGPNQKLFGKIELLGGSLSKAKIVEMKLGKSKILFSGPPKSAVIDLTARTVIEKTEIELRLQGTLDQPNLQLESNPPLPQEQLLVMLFTGKSWKSTQEALAQGQISEGLVLDFLDYLVFSGSGAKIAQELGISDFSLKYNQGLEEFNVKKDISEKATLGYGVTQSKTDAGAAEVTQKVGGEYKVTESISVGAEKELKQNGKQAQEQPKPDDKVFLKYKKQF
ncbi:MAG: translocation/assembly module TamB domain-containing protein [Candidatus Omnitrophica bacterium]|nr:translocation/assembly module TamB domain-containing protein [Candidatus Omnitrophota bacterium]